MSMVAKFYFPRFLREYDEQCFWRRPFPAVRSVMAPRPHILSLSLVSIKVNIRGLKLSYLVNTVSFCQFITSTNEEFITSYEAPTLLEVAVLACLDTGYVGDTARNVSNTPRGVSTNLIYFLEWDMAGDTG